MAASTVSVSPRLLRTPDAARYIGVHRSTLHREAVAGRIRPITKFKYWLFDVSDLDTFIENLKQQ